MHAYFHARVLSCNVPLFHGRVHFAPSALQNCHEHEGCELVVIISVLFLGNREKYCINFVNFGV